MKRHLQMVVVPFAVMLTQFLGNTSANAAETARATGPVSASTARGAPCHWMVVANGARVRIGPGVRYRVIKLKWKGDKVTGPYQSFSWAPSCIPRTSADGHLWVIVYLTRGGIGWMAADNLRVDKRKAASIRTSTLRSVTVARGDL